LELALEALEADWRDGNLDGDPTMAMVFCDSSTIPSPTTLTTVQGPR
jgi:Integrase zinc binding domain